MTGFALSLAACEVQKSANPLSPNVAGPIAGVTLSAPEPAAPPNGVVLNANQSVTIGFNAASSTGVRPFWYELDIAKSIDFSDLVRKVDRLTPPAEGGRVNYEVSPALPAEQIYYWRVRALDGANTGPYSLAHSFELASPVVLGAPVPVSPKGHALIDSNTVSLVAGNAAASGPVQGGVTLHFQLARDQGFGQVVGAPTAPQGSGSTAVSIGDLEADRDYFWRVYASTQTRLGEVQSPYSAIESFRTPAAPAPPPTGPVGSPADQLDLNQVTWLHRNVSRWPATSTLTEVTVTRDTVCMPHTRAGTFPTSPFGSIVVEGNAWIFANINGRWYGATWDWLRVGQVCKGATAEEFGRDQIRVSPMDASWVPRAGDMIGFMVSTRARDDVKAGEERTNVVLIRWPY